MQPSTATETSWLIEAQALSRRFGYRWAVRNLDVRLARGEILGFLGANGAGKTTTMQLLTGNLAPSAGHVRIDGVDLQAFPLRAKRAIGYLPERPPVYPELSVDAYLDYSAALHGLRGPARRRARERVKERCGLGEAGRRIIGNLSKGFQQRVGIAQALIHDPPLIILDEPTVGLDPLQIRGIRELIRELGQAHGVLISTHLLSEVEALCNRVLILREGVAVYSGALTGGGQADSGPPRFEVEFLRPPGAQALAALPGLATIEPLTAGRYRLGIAVSAEANLSLDSPRVRDLLERWVMTSCAEGWGLVSLVPLRPNLEQLFMSLSFREPGALD